MTSSPLVVIDPVTHQVRIDLIYASAANLSGKVIYRDLRCQLHRDAEALLAEAVRLARLAGFALLIFDAYRPQYAQQMLWDALPDPDYVRDPKLGSHHTRGVAVDLTLLGADGEPLDMGTGFDDMRPLSHHFNADLPEAVQRNRLMLLGIMLAAGFESLPTEWWHYQLPEAENYPLLG